MSQRTSFLARLIGLYFIIVSLSMLSHKEATIAAVMVLLHDAPALMLLGLIVLGCGLALVLGHNEWSGGALSVVVTLIGWSALGKGLLFVFLSPETLARLYLDTLAYERAFYFYAAVSLLLGIYLTLAGFKLKREGLAR